MKTKKRKKSHGLTGGATKSALRHSDVKSGEHLKHSRQKVWGGQATFVEVRSFPHEMLAFVTRGSLKTPGNLGWRIRDGKLENVPAAEAIEDVDKFVREVRAAGGVYRKGRVYKGKVYYQKSPADAAKRHTIVMPPWFSKFWASSTPVSRDMQKGFLADLVYKLAKERWPDVKVLALSLHDDTANLHVDVWGTELKKVEVELKGQPVERYVHKQSFLQGSVGPGTVYLQSKKDLGHELHPEDVIKLERSLDQYALSRLERKRKKWPEVPEAIQFQRKLEASISALFQKKDTDMRFKKMYLEFCKALDRAKYKVFNQIEEQIEELRLEAVEIDMEWANLEGLRAEAARRLVTLKETQAKARELMEKAQMRLDNFLDTNAYALAVKKAYPTDSSIIKFCQDDPELAGILADRAKISKNEYWSKFYRISDKVLDKNRLPDIEII